jgi:hypothetical protein
MTTQEVLLQAAAIVEQGWCQGEYTDEAGRHCAAGDIYRAAANGTSNAGVSYDNGSMATRVFMQFIGGYVSNWNDAPERTQADVVTALREAAQRAEVR